MPGAARSFGPPSPARSGLRTPITNRAGVPSRRWSRYWTSDRGRQLPASGCARYAAATSRSPRITDAPPRRRRAGTASIHPSVRLVPSTRSDASTTGIAAQARTRNAAPFPGAASSSLQARSRGAWAVAVGAGAGMSRFAERGERERSMTARRGARRLSHGIAGAERGLCSGSGTGNTKCRRGGGCAVGVEPATPARRRGGSGGGEDRNARPRRRGRGDSGDRGAMEHSGRAPAASETTSGAALPRAPAARAPAVTTGRPRGAG